MNDTAATVAWCLHEALVHDLPALEIPESTTGAYARARRFLRPTDVDANVSVHSWPQSWSNTGLGMGGPSGQAFTTALTTVVVDEDQRWAAVYVGRHLRGVVEADHEFMTRLAHRTVIKSRFPEGTPWINTPKEP